MIMKHILLAQAFVIVSATLASAQPQPAQPAAPAAPAAPVPHVSAPPVPHVSAQPTLQDFHLYKIAPLPTEPTFFEHTRQHTVEQMLTLAQQAKPSKEVKTVTVVEPFSVFTGEPKSVEAWYSQARSFIERDQYDRALAPLDRVIDGRGDRADAAMYWKAYSLWKLVRRDDALSTLSQLQKQYAESRWI
jgi:TolA-binding protein